MFQSAITNDERKISWQVIWKALKGVWNHCQIMNEVNRRKVSSAVGAEAQAPASRKDENTPAEWNDVINLVEENHMNLDNPYLTLQDSYGGETN